MGPPRALSAAATASGPRHARSPHDTTSTTCRTGPRRGRTSATFAPAEAGAILGALVARGALRWRADAPDDPASARQRVLDAAEACFARDGISKTTVEDIARAAGISRATVYRSFSDGRDEIVLGVVVREADRYLTRLDGRIAGRADLADAIVEFVSTTVHAA